MQLITADENNKEINTYLMLNCASSGERDSLKPETANFDDAYTAYDGVPTSPPIELTVIIWPLFRFFIDGNTARIP